MTDIVVAMIEPESQGNIGAIARAMKNFGLKELYLVNPKDSLGDEARKMAVHAQRLQLLRRRVCGDRRLRVHGRLASAVFR